MSHQIRSPFNISDPAAARALAVIFYESLAIIRAAPCKGGCFQLRILLSDRCCTMAATYLIVERPVHCRSDESVSFWVQNSPKWFGFV